MDDKNITEIQDPTPALATVKRRRGFSLLDLMVLAALFAISFSILQNASKVSGAINLKDPIWNGVYQGVVTVFTSLTLFAAIQILRGWWDKERRFHPGYLLIWLELIAMVFRVVGGVVFAWISNSEFNSSVTDGSGALFASALFGSMIAYRCVTIGLALFGSFTKASNWGWCWRVTFAAIALFNISCIVQTTAVHSADLNTLSLVVQVNGVIFILMALSVIASAIADAMTGLCRDTSHWIGVVCFLGLPIFSQCFVMVALRYFEASDVFQSF